MGKKSDTRVVSDIKDEYLTEHEVERLFELGENYEYGEVVKQDYGAAFEIYQKCAAKGYSPALNKLGWFYHNGLAVDEDIDKAFEYYTRAAAMNDSVAMVNLGNIYENNDFDEDEIDWKSDEMNPTIEIKQKKVKNKRTNKVITITKKEKVPSFFSSFRHFEKKEGENKEKEEEDEDEEGDE